jgi:hypothetical protein
MIQFTWQGHHWKQPNFVYGKLQDGGIGVHHLPSRIQTLRFTFIQKLIANNNKGNAWLFQAYNIRAYAPALQAENIIKLRLNPTKYSVMTPFCASAFKAWHTMTPIQNPNLQSYVNLKRPTNNLTPLLIPKYKFYKNFLKLNLNKHILVNGECYWKLGNPK